MSRRRGAGAADPAGGSGAGRGDLFATALSHHRAGRLSEAERLYRTVLEQRPDHPGALHLLGVIAHQAGRNDVAAELIGKAVALRPDDAEAHSNLGNVLRELGRPAASLAACQRAVRLKPGFPEAHNNLGNALRALGDPEAAIAAYRRAIELRAEYAEACSNLGAVLRDRGMPEPAVTWCQKAVALKPGSAQAQNNLGIALQAGGRAPEAEAALRQAVALSPGYAEAHNNLGNLLAEQGRLAAAEAAYRTAGSAAPGHASTWSNLASLLKDQGRLDEAMAACRAALALKPDHAVAHSNLLLTMNYAPETGPEEILAEARRWQACHGTPRGTPGRPPGNDRDPARRLRVGYVSPDLCSHSVSHFLEPLLSAHDRRAVEVFCYADVARPDAQTTTFRELADAWRVTAGMSDDKVAARVRDDAIDILVDLAGHTAGNRLRAFAEHPAPVQVTWLGYAGTTGLEAMDYRLTDAVADPPDGADALHVERLVRLPHGFLCYRRPTAAPAVTAPPSRETGFATFGSFNNLPKITGPVVEAWARLLAAVPGARLLIKSRPLGDATTCRRYRQLFASHGVARDRVDLIGTLASAAEHLGLYGRIDVALDSFPYNGATTTCEALWMGVPVVTLAGNRSAGRIGASLLTRLDLQELIAEDIDGYVRVARALAGDAERLAELRGGLRQRMTASPLIDADGFARAVEAAYRDLWRTWCAGRRADA